MSRGKKWQMILMLMLSLSLLLTASSGCAKTGTSGLIFYEFFDPT